MLRLTSNIALAASSVCVFATMPALAKSYAWQMENFCRSGATSIPKGYQRDTRVFAASIGTRTMTLSDEAVSPVLKETRPSRQDVGWYRSGMTDTRVLFNVGFDGEADNSLFSRKQTTEDSVLRKRWTLDGNCEVNS